MWYCSMHDWLPLYQQLSENDYEYNYLPSDARAQAQVAPGSATPMVGMNAIQNGGCIELKTNYISCVSSLYQISIEI